MFEPGHLVIFLVMEHFFTTYVRTKLIHQHRLKDLKNYDSVKIYMYELDRLGVKGPVLYDLKLKGEINYDSKGFFTVADMKGPIDSTLLDRGRRRTKVDVPLSKLHLYMRDQLNKVSLKTKVGVPVYFKAFLQHRNKDLKAFFRVDDFAGRVHSPVVNLKHDMRKYLRLNGKEVVSLDVKQMQPMILARVLFGCLGSNAFSDVVMRGDDVYLLLQRLAGLNSRKDAKKLLFQLIFGKPMGQLGNLIKGDSKWVDWINMYKSTEEVKNPHKEDRHTNLAWLLQYSEVQVMSEIWKRLMQEEIPFLTIHDDVLCMRGDEDKVYSIMDDVLGQHFTHYNIVVTK